jgi:hypothetical protein
VIAAVVGCLLAGSVLFALGALGDDRARLAASLAVAAVVAVVAFRRPAALDVAADLSHAR